MRYLNTCSYPSCRHPALYHSEHCWEHLKDKEGFRKSLVAEVYEGKDFETAVFSGADLSRLNLAGMLAKGADFTGVDLYKVLFAGADLRESKLIRCRMNYTCFDRSDLRGATLNCSVGKTVNAIDVDFSHGEAKQCKFIDANFQNSKFSESNWCGTTLSSCDLSRIEAKDWYAEHLNLSGSNLSKADCQFAVFGGSMLDNVTAIETNFDRTNLIGVSARYADFRKSSFYYARLTSGCFDRANFRECNLTRAVLRTATFYVANMEGAEMSSAVIDRAKFGKSPYSYAEANYDN